MALVERPGGTVVHLVATGVRRFRLDGIDDTAVDGVLPEAPPPPPTTKE